MLTHCPLAQVPSVEARDELAQAGLISQKPGSPLQRTGLQDQAADAQTDSLRHRPSVAGGHAGQPSVSHDETPPNAEQLGETVADAVADADMAEHDRLQEKVS